jgi:positive phototaxis protein PixI
MNVSEIIQLGAPERKKLGAAYLKVLLDRDTPAAISMDSTRAALSIEPSRIAPMPNMPTHVVGMLSHRSRVFWVIDLAKMLGMPAVNLRQPKLNVLLLEVDSLSETFRERQSIALLVPQIDGVMRFLPEEVISPLGNFSAELVPYLHGWLPHSRDILLVLSTRALVTSPLAPKK